MTSSGGSDSGPPPAAAPHARARARLEQRTQGFSDTHRWLQRGWQDFRRCPAIGLFYGGCFMVMGWALLKVYEAAPAYVMALKELRGAKGEQQYISCFLHCSCFKNEQLTEGYIHSEYHLSGDRIVIGPVT